PDDPPAVKPEERRRPGNCRAFAVHRVTVDLAAAVCVAAEVGVRTADGGRQRSHEGEVAVVRRTKTGRTRFDAAAPEPLRVDLVLRVVLAVVVVPVRGPLVVAAQREPDTGDRIARLKHARATVL